MAEVKDLLTEQESVREEQPQTVVVEAALVKKKMSPKKRKKLIRTAVVLALLAAVGLGARKLLDGGESSAPQEVITNEVTYGSITSVVKGSGVTKASSSETITLTTAGTVLEVLVEENQQVNAGDPLFTIDSPAAQMALQRAQSEVDGYAGRLAALEKNLEGLNLAAEYSGKVVDVVRLQPGDKVSAGMKVATLQDDTRLRLEQYYSYAYAGQIKAGQSAEVSIPALMTTVTGKVESVHMVSRITEEGAKLFVAEIVIPNPGILTAGMSASATVKLGNEEAYPYEAAELAFYRTRDITTTVGGTVISCDLRDYLNVSAGQVLLHIDGENGENEKFTLQQQLEEAEKNLRIAEQNLANCNAVSPISGRVIGLALRPGMEVAANTAVITIADTSRITVNAQVDERSISFVKMGMFVDLDQWGNMFSGMVESVSLSSTVNNGVATYPMVISAENFDGRINVNSSVNYSLVASQVENCLVLPIQCVREVPLDDGTTARVVFVQGDRPENAIEISVQVDGVPEDYWPVPVEIGIQDNYNVEIKSGVEEGTVVFTQVQSAYGWG